MMPEMIYTLLIGSVIFLLTKRLDNWIDPPVEVPLKAKKTYED